MQNKIECSFDEMFEYIKSCGREKVFLVDIRSYEERILDGNIENDDLFCPIDLLMRDFSCLPEDKKIIIYCRSGVRSLLMANFLKEKDFFEVWSLSGGILEYNERFKKK